jgi:hypothetical protein
MYGLPVELRPSVVREICTTQHSGLVRERNTWIVELPGDLAEAEGGMQGERSLIGDLSEKPNRPTSAGRPRHTGDRQFPADTSVTSGWEHADPHEVVPGGRSGGSGLVRRVDITNATFTDKCAVLVSYKETPIGSQEVINQRSPPTLRITIARISESDGQLAGGIKVSYIS